MGLGTKKSRSRRNPNPDRLSELPDSLLLEVLSWLEMKDVVKTGILSKRWQNLWKDAHSLVFKFHVDEGDDSPNEDYRVLAMRQLQLFGSFVYETLRQHRSHIRMFSLCAFVFSDDNGRYNLWLDDWIKCVLEKRVEVLEIEFSHVSGVSYTTPCILFLSPTSFTKLALTDLRLPELLVPVKWNLLKSLCLREVLLSGPTLENVLLGCPVLECLTLEMIDHLLDINIKSSSVRQLKLVDFWHSYGASYSDSELKIRAPWVQELEISGRFLVTKCQIEDVSSLVKATLTFTAYETSLIDEYDEEELNADYKDFNVGWFAMVPHLIKALSHAAELSIGTELMQVLSFAVLTFYEQPSLSFLCKDLTINSPLWNFDMIGIACLLRNAPHLETLVINVSCYQHELPLYPVKELLDDEDIEFNLPNGNFVHLKNVKIDYHRNFCADSPEYIGGNCNDVELVGHIMRSAVALERLVLCSSSPSCTAWPRRYECSKANCSFQYVPRLSSKLLTNFLPGIEDEEWELKKRKFSYEYRFSNYASPSP